MIFFKNNVIDMTTVEIEAIESNVALGKCTLVMDNNVADVTMLNFDSNAPYIVEGLLRAAYNYAGLKNYYLARCTASGIDAFLDKMNFTKSDGVYCGDIPSVLMGSCCK